MYAPTQFREQRRKVLVDTIRALQFAAVVIFEDSRFSAVHVPVLVRERGAEATIEFHVAVGNGFWRAVGEGARALLMVQGPQAYVHPGWLATKKDTGRVVPTWNYVAVQAEGQVTATRDADWLMRHVRDLTAANEAGRAEPWAPEDAPADYLDKAIAAIVGLELRVEKLEGVWKMIQHHSEANRAGVIAGLSASTDPRNRAVAEIMREQLASSGG